MGWAARANPNARLAKQREIEPKKPNASRWPALFASRAAGWIKFDKRRAAEEKSAA